MSTIKEETVKVEVKSEDYLDNAFLSQNEQPVGESIDCMVDERVNANFKCKEEIKDEPSETFNIFITENQQNIEEFSQKHEIDVIDISDIILQSSQYTYNNEKENDSKNQKAFTERNSPDDDNNEKKCRSTMSSNSNHGKKAKTKNCQFCNKFFTKKRDLDDHLLKHHKQEIKGDLKSFITSKIYTCNICNLFETTHKGYFNRHFNSVHNEARVKMKCQFCTESFATKPTKDEHVLRKHKDKIENNFKSFITSKIHACKICNSYETMYKSHLVKHMDSVHNEAKVKIECQFCTKSFTTQTTLDGHVIRKHKDKIESNVKSIITSKIHTCNICNSYETMYKSHLKQHMNSFHNEAKVKIECQLCKKSFFFKRSLDEHLLRKHKDEIMNNFKTFITSKIHVCKICNSFETTFRSCLDQHKNSFHNEAKVKIECQFCIKSFFFKSSVRRHVLSKHKDEIKNNFKSFKTSKIHVCLICNSYETTQKLLLDKHINSSHNEIKNKMKCQFCPDSFTSKMSLHEHVLREHQDKITGDITSDIEGKNKANLKKHLESNCHLTDKSIVKVKNLHQNEERKKEIYICDICAYQAKRKHRLISHFKSVHNRVNNKDFITKKSHCCKICSYQTTNTAILDTHIVSNHNNLRIIIQRMKI